MGRCVISRRFYTKHKCSRKHLLRLHSRTQTVQRTDKMTGITSAVIKRGAIIVCSICCSAFALTATGVLLPEASEIPWLETAQATHNSSTEIHSESSPPPAEIHSESPPGPCSNVVIQTTLKINVYLLCLLTSIVMAPAEHQLAGSIPFSSSISSAYETKNLY